VITVGILAQWALRSSILILSGVVLLKALRVKDPSVRLASWTAILCGSVAIPLLTATLPSMPVRTRTAAVPRAAIYRAPPAPVAAVFRQQEPGLPSPKRFDWTRAAVGAYVVVAAVLLLRLCLGLAMSWRLLHRSRPTELIGVRESGHIASPVTLGIARPVIVLPADWREWDATKLEAVLAHERSHIRRRDPAVQVLSAIHRALLWYSPLSWFLDRQIVRLAEQASDDAAVAAIRDRASYAEVLLEFMQRGVRRANWQDSWQGVPMARYGQPEQRIHRILDATTLSRGATRWSIAAILALGLPLAYVIAAARPGTPEVQAQATPQKEAAPSASEQLAFDAASIKPANPNLPDGHIVVGMQQPTGGPGTGDPGRIRYPIICLKLLVPLLTT
jgi:beta-lactamase regulating signal transducer with metallopeptidase domain